MIEFGLPSIAVLMISGRRRSIHERRTDVVALIVGITIGIEWHYEGRWLLLCGMDRGLVFGNLLD